MALSMTLHGSRHTPMEMMKWMTCVLNWQNIWNLPLKNLGEGDSVRDNGIFLQSPKKTLDFWTKNDILSKHARQCETRTTTAKSISGKTAPKLGGPSNRGVITPSVWKEQSGIKTCRVDARYSCVECSTKQSSKLNGQRIVRLFFNLTPLGGEVSPRPHKPD